MKKIILILSMLMVGSIAADTKLGFCKDEGVNCPGGPYRRLCDNCKLIKVKKGMELVCNCRSNDTTSLEKHRKSVLLTKKRYEVYFGDLREMK